MNDKKFPLFSPFIAPCDCLIKALGGLPNKLNNYDIILYITKNHLAVCLPVCLFLLSKQSPAGGFVFFSKNRQKLVKLAQSEFLQAERATPPGGLALKVSGKAYLKDKILKPSDKVVLITL